jgi:hypothetical protein
VEVTPTPSLYVSTLQHVQPDKVNEQLAKRNSATIFVAVKGFCGFGIHMNDGVGYGKKGRMEVPPHNFKFELKVKLGRIEFG